eukprot:5245334-Amphidinium_carterae.1
MDARKELTRAKQILSVLQLQSDHGSPCTYRGHGRRLAPIESVRLNKALATKAQIAFHGQFLQTTEQSLGDGNGSYQAQPAKIRRPMQVNDPFEPDIPWGLVWNLFPLLLRRGETFQGELHTEKKRISAFSSNDDHVTICRNNANVFGTHIGLGKEAPTPTQKHKSGPLEQQHTIDTQARYLFHQDQDFIPLFSVARPSLNSSFFP